MLAGLILPLPAVGDSAPTQPCRFQGSVTAGGVPVIAGTEVSASVPGVATTWTTYTGSVEESGPADYRLDVPADSPGGEKDGALFGDTVSFEVYFGGFWCDVDQTYTWQSGGIINLDLTVNSLDYQAPPVPTLLSPADGAKTNLTAVPLDWSDVNDRTPPVIYSVQVDNDIAFSSPEVNVTGLSSSGCTTPDLDAGTYYWRVRAGDSASPPNESDWSAARSFTIDLTPPPAPSLSYPASGTITADSTPSFGWSSVFDPSGVTYTIQVDNNSDFSSPELNVGGISSSAYTPLTPLANNAYFWRVKAVDGAGNSGAWSASWTLIVFSSISLPTLLSPANGARINDTTPDLDWADVFDPSAVTYSLQVATNSGFTTLVVNASSLSASFYTTTTLSNGTYYWRVRAKDGLGNDSGWTGAWSFTLDTTPPGTPTLLLPANGAKTMDNTPSLDWSNVTDSSGVTYSLQVDNNSDFSSPEVSFGNLTSSFYTTALLADGTYYWHVRAVDGVGNVGNWTTSWSFSIDSTVGLPILLLPADTAKINNSTPNLDWSDVSDPSGVTYSLQVSTSNTFATTVVNVSGLTASNYTTATLGQVTYYWRVKAVDGAGNDSGWTAAWSFTIDTTSPLAPSLVSPANGAKTNDNTPDLDWSDVSDTSGVTYSLQVSTNNTFISTVVNVSGLLSSAYTPVASLADATYYWRVRAVDGAGNTGSWSTTRNFIVDITAPAIPTLISPTDGTKTNDTTPSLDWSDVSDPSGVTYSVQVDDNNDFSSPAVNASSLASSTYTTPSLSQVTYYWRVRAVDGTGDASDWSTAWSFTVDTVAPGAPTLLSPASGSRTNNPTPTLDWSDVSDPSGVTYSLQVSTSNTFATTVVNVSGLTASNYTTATLGQVTYYWRVKAVDGAGNGGSWTTGMAFTIDTTAPAVPVLQSPGNGTATSDNTTSLDWSDVTDPSGVSYSLQVDNNSDFSSPEMNASGLSSSAYTTAALADGIYYWRVKAVDGVGNSSNWTSAWRFTVDTVAPVIPQQLSPASGAKTKNQTPTLDWSDVSDFSGVTYSLQVSVSSTFSTTVVNVSGLTTSNYTTATLSQATYYWRVKAIDRAGNDSGWSGAWNFTIDTTPPTAPTLSSPANGARIDSATPSLGWSGVSDPSGVSYRVQVDDNSTFSSPEIDVSGLSSSNYTTTTLAQGTYYWHVKAVDGAGNEGVWSAQRSFILDTAPAVPMLLSPLNGSRLRIASPSLDWSDVSDPQGVSYSLQVADNSNFSSPVVNITGWSVSAYNINATLAEKTYYWRVRAVDGGGKASDWTGSWSFMVDLTPPVVTLALSGAVLGGTASSNFAIVMVEYCIDGGAWGNASASDGVFNAMSENYSVSLSLPALGDGTHTIEVRVTDAFGDTASAAKSFASQQLFYNANQGWNLVTYQGPGKPISEAWGSIMGKLIVVWAYDSQHGVWHGYNPSVPSWANDLFGLVQGAAYWVRVSGSCTWIYEV